MNKTRRYIECVLFVGVWMAAGWWFRLRASQTTHEIYLLIGIPLLILFQLVVARRPLRQLWVRESGTFHLDGIGVVLAVILMSLPIVLTVMNRHSPAVAFFMVSVVGGVPAAYALRRQSVDGLRRGLPGFATAVLVGAAFFVTFALRDGRSPLFAWDKLPLLAVQFWAMFNGGFVVEEVVFRGALDSHLTRDSVDSSRDWRSAVFVSALWGLWHLPLDEITGLRSLGGWMTEELCQQIAVGVPLSLCWRRSGTLVLPVAAHALIDAYRNMIVVG